MRRASAESRDSSQHIGTAAQPSKASEAPETSKASEEAEIGNEEAEIGKGIGSELGCENENGN